jgi:hypothetical protein
MLLAIALVLDQRLAIVRIRPPDLTRPARHASAPGVTQEQMSVGVR